MAVETAVFLIFLNVDNEVGCVFRIGDSRSPIRRLRTRRDKIQIERVRSQTSAPVAPLVADGDAHGRRFCAQTDLVLRVANAVALVDLQPLIVRLEVRHQTHVHVRQLSTA
jgi:hypothetical protein